MRVRALLAVGLVAGLLVLAMLMERSSGRFEETSASPIRTSVGSSSKSPEISVATAFVNRSIRIGRSARGRPIVARHVGDPATHDTVLVVGCIHGNECAGISVARDLGADPGPTRLNLWIIPDLNPDGFAAGTRQNAHRVDLNRNFLWRWQPIGGPGAFDFSGPRPLSEPESRAAHGLILRIHPEITIWFHQDEALVDESGGNLAIERHYAHLVGLPLRRLPRYPGSATGWENHRYPRSTAFVVELPPGALSDVAVERLADAVLRLT